MSWERTYRSDRHLASAIDRSLISFMYEHRKHPSLPKIYKELFQDDYSPSPHGWLCLYDTLLKQGDLPRSSLFSRDVEISIRLAEISSGCHLQSRVNIEKPEIPQAIKSLYLMRMFLEEIRDNVGKSTIETVEYTKGVTLHFIGELVKFTCPTCRRSHIEPYTSFLCLIDVVNGNFTSLLYTYIRSTLFHDPRDYHHCHQTLLSMWSLLRRYTNKAYEVFKLMPSMATGAILRDMDPIDGGKYLGEILKALPIGMTADADVQYLIRKVCNKKEAHILLECAGLWKMAGHPTISHDIGILKVRQEGNKPKMNVSAVARRLTHAFRLTFCREYFRKTGHWPNVNVSKCPPVIQTSYNTGSWRELPHSPWPPSYFENLVFKKTFDFDFHPDISELVSDTSIMGGLSQWHYEASPEWAHRVKYGRGYKHRRPRQPNKAILSLLKFENQSLEKIFQVISSRDIPQDWNIIGLVPKERENKEGPRYFAKCPMEIRYWQVATEKGLAENILKYLRYQSMTMSDDVLQARLLSMSQSVSDSHEIKAVCNILDFSSWNLQFRHETVVDLLTDIDNLYGLDGIYTYTHIFPMMSTILVKDYGCPIEEDPDTGCPRFGNRCFPGQESFFEGMRQKGWTLFTICLILSVAIDKRYRIELLGQGDNQAIIIYIPRRIQKDIPQIIKYVDSFCEKLYETCELVQIPIKREESWRSCLLFEYARVSFLEGAQVSVGMKKASRISSESNNATSSLASDLAGVGSLGVTIASGDSCPLPAYILATFETLQILRLKANKLYVKEPAYLTSLLLLSRIVGGLPVVPYSSYCIRGNPDPLSDNISLITWAWVHHSDLRPWLRLLVRLAPSSRNDPVLLIQDPASLRLSLPIRSENKLKELLRETVREVSGNSFIQALFSETANSQREALVADLMQITPRNPRVLNFIFNSSNVGLQDRMIGRFSSPLTITKSSAETISSYPELWSIIAMFDEHMIDHYDLPPRQQNTTLEELYLNPPSLCSFVVAEHLRERHWGPLVGITMPPPWEQLKVIPWDNKNNTGDAIRARVLKCNRDCFFERGPCHPYIGSDTAEKIRRPPLSVTGTTSIVRSAIRMTEVMPWIAKGEDTNLTTLLTRLISEKEIQLVEPLSEISGTICGGSLYHRLRDQATDHGARVNASHTFGSHIAITSDTLESVSRMSQDYTLFFQQVKAYILSYFRHLALFSPCVPGDYSAVISCPTCFNKIEDPILHLPLPPQYTGIPLPLPPSNVVIRKNFRTPTSSAPDSPQHLISLAMARLSLSFFLRTDTTHTVDMISGLTLSTYTPLNMTDLRLCDPKTFMLYLSLYVRPRSSMARSIQKIRLEHEITKFHPLPSLVRLLLISGLLPNIFTTFKHRSDDEKWYEDDVKCAREFYFLLTKISMSNLPRSLLPTPPICTSIDSDEHISHLRKVFGVDPVVTLDPDSLIALNRKSISGNPSSSPSATTMGPILKEIMSCDYPPVPRQPSLHYLSRVLDSGSDDITNPALCSSLVSTVNPAHVLTINDQGGYYAALAYKLFPSTTFTIQFAEDEQDITPNSALRPFAARLLISCELMELKGWNLLHSGTTKLNSLEMLSKIKRVCPNPTIILGRIPGDYDLAPLLSSETQEIVVLCQETIVVPPGFKPSVHLSSENPYDSFAIVHLIRDSQYPSARIDLATYLSPYTSHPFYHDVQMVEIGMELINTFSSTPELLWITALSPQSTGDVNVLELLADLIKELIHHLINISCDSQCPIPSSSLDSSREYIPVSVYKDRVTVLSVIRQCILQNRPPREALQIPDTDEEWHIDSVRTQYKIYQSLCSTKRCSLKGWIQHNYNPRTVLLDNLPFYCKLYTYHLYSKRNL